MTRPAPRAFVIDDDREMRESLNELLTRAGWEADILSSARDALKRIADNPPDVVLSDVRMPGMTGMELLEALAAQPDSPPVVLVSAHGDIPMAVSAMQQGAYTFLEKPFDPHRLLTALDHAAEQHRLRRSTARLKARLARLSGIDRVLLGQTPPIRALREEVMDIADTNAPVLVQGETGTGKELVARALHDLSPRSGGPFAALSCATLPADHFEQTLFGTSEQSGVLANAAGGTLFLDEVAACPPDAQAKLLRVLETGEYIPLGTATPRRADIRLVSASNEELQDAVGQGRFREDLMFRLNTLVITLPPLRDRHDDIPLLFTHFLSEYAALYETRAPETGPDDIAALLAHHWPGNVRELRHVAERRVLAARRGAGSVAEALSPRGPQPEDIPENLRGAVAALERQMIARALQTHQGRMDDVAGALGIGRRTLNEKIVKLGLDKDTIL